MAAEAYDQVEDFIRANWDRTIRSGCPASDGEIALAHPFVVPTADDTFRTLFYWDTFYAALGLEEHGRHEVVDGCADNFIDLIETLGCVPNSTRRSHINRSQPPHAWCLFALVDGRRRDPVWLERAYRALEREYAFWMTHRAFPSGLNHHGHHATPRELADFWELDTLWVRFRQAPEEPVERHRWLGHVMAEAETGWDFNPRFDRRCDEHEAVDLNALLHGHEATCAALAEELGHRVEAERWTRRARERRERMNERLWDAEDGLYRDRDLRHDRLSAVASAATLLPLWTGVASAEQAARIVENLPRFERGGGLACCEDGGREHVQQWDYPNAWPPLQYYAVEGLRRYGYEADARRLARSYLDCVASTFASTGELWEKYNAETGDAEVQDEYEMPPMLGWTAGIFVAFRRYLDV